MKRPDCAGSWSNGTTVGPLEVGVRCKVTFDFEPIFPAPTPGHRWERFTRGVNWLRWKLSTLGRPNAPRKFAPGSVNTFRSHGCLPTKGLQSSGCERNAAT